MVKIEMRFEATDQGEVCGLLDASGVETTGSGDTEGPEEVAAGSVVVATEFDGSAVGVLELTGGVEGSPPTIGVLVAIGGVDEATVVVPVVPELSPVPFPSLPLVGIDGGAVVTGVVVPQAPVRLVTAPFTTVIQ